MVLNAVQTLLFRAGSLWMELSSAKQLDWYKETESFEIAESWQRLAFDPENIQPHDLTLIYHELMEMRLVNEGLTQDEAHIITSRKYNYLLKNEG